MPYQNVRGMRDFLGEQARLKRFIEWTFVDTFERYGFSPLETPVVEELGLLTEKGSAGEEIRKEIYEFKDKGGRDLGLRFDMTVPLARVVVGNPQLRKPYRRYVVGRVYRYDRPQAKRYREFTQADVDVVGSTSVVCEYECIMVALEALEALGVQAQVQVNSREVVEALTTVLGVPKEKCPACYRALDKMEKIGVKGVEKELQENGLDASIAGFFEKATWKDVEEKLSGGEEAKEPLAKMVRLMEMLKESGVDVAQKIKIAPNMVRGLDYYTGIVFEVVVEGGPSLGAGGRYDKLIELYGGPPTPAVGISFGIDRILDTVEGNIQLPVESQVLLAPVSEEQVGKVLALARALREADVNVEVDVKGRAVAKNLAYASKATIPYVAVIGEKELESQKFKLRNMQSGKEKEFAFSDAKGVAGLIEANDGY